jgi:hypothetical protein
MNPILPCRVPFSLHPQSYPYQQDAKPKKKKTVNNIPLHFTRQNVASENKPVTWDCNPKRRGRSHSDKAYFAHVVACRAC